MSIIHSAMGQGTTRPLRANRRGVAMITAIVLVGLVGVVVLAMTALLTADARRTRDIQIEAQLQELLRIAAADAHERLRENRLTAEEIVIELPPVLRDEGMSLRCTVTREGLTAAAVISAAAGDNVARQTVIFANENSRWQIQRATLE